MAVKYIPPYNKLSRKSTYYLEISTHNAIQ